MSGQRVGRERTAQVRERERGACELHLSCEHRQQQLKGLRRLSSARTLPMSAVGALTQHPTAQLLPGYISARSSCSCAHRTQPHITTGPTPHVPSAVTSMVHGRLA